MTQRILAGDLRTGRITTVLPATDAGWTDTLNAAGTVEGVTVPDDVLRALNVRGTLPAARSFLAFEDDDRIRQAGPLWSRTRNWQAGNAVLAAAGLWSIFDYRKVVPVLSAGIDPQDQTVTLSNTDLGGIARGLVATALTHTGGDLPVVLPTAAVGTHTESFPGWKLLTVSEQIRELTQREAEAPDVSFTPRRRADDERYLEWVMRVGTAADPLLHQTGADWVFDASAPRSSVLGITTDEDARVMGMRAWETGNGQEADILLSWAQDDTLIAAGWPLLEVDESRPTVEVQATLDAHCAALLNASARPAEVYKVTVRREAAAEVRPGDYCRLITRNDAWLGDMDKRMRIRQVVGDLTDQVVLDMYSLAADL